MLAAAEFSYAILLASSAAQAEPLAADLQPYIQAEPIIGAGEKSDEVYQNSPKQPPANDVAGDDVTGDAPNDVPDENIIIVTAPTDTPGDPLEGINLETFEAAQKVDKAIVEPVAKAYEGVLPKPVRDGLSNFTNNLNEPVNFVNFLLQLKIGKAFETLGRFAVNTTLGVGGIFDVAKSDTFNLPYRSNGFANTLGYYGVEPGPYLFLPVVGSTTVRDFAGDGLDALFLPRLLGKPFNRPTFSAPVTGIRALNRRIDFDERNGDFVEESSDPYAANRDLYLDQRQREIDILRGRIPDPLSGDATVCHSGSICSE